MHLFPFPLSKNPLSLRPGSPRLSFIGFLQASSDPLLDCGASTNSTLLELSDMPDRDGGLVDDVSLLPAADPGLEFAVTFWPNRTLSSNWHARSSRSLFLLSISSWSLESSSEAASLVNAIRSSISSFSTFSSSVSGLRISSQNKLVKKKQKRKNNTWQQCSNQKWKGTTQHPNISLKLQARYYLRHYVLAYGLSSQSKAWISLKVINFNCLFFFPCNSNILKIKQNENTDSKVSW